MSRFRSLSHTEYECKYHIVFCLKYRFKVLTGEIKRYVQQEVYGLCRQKDKVEVMEINIQEEHVHMLLSIPPKYSVSSMMGFIKGKLAIKLFQRYSGIGKKYWGRHMWSRGYCVSTVGLNEETIRKYVKFQKKRQKEIDQGQMELFD